jgi:hypothetical protein
MVIRDNYVSQFLCYNFSGRLQDIFTKRHVNALNLTNKE